MVMYEYRWRRPPAEPDMFWGVSESLYRARRTYEQLLCRAPAPSPEIDAARAAVEQLEEELHRVDRWRLHLCGVIADTIHAGMETLGMTFWVSPDMPAPQWPKASDFNVTDLAWVDEDVRGQPWTVDERALQEAADLVRAWHGPPRRGIPGHKIAGTNDGWIVTVTEIQHALTIHDATPNWYIDRVLADAIDLQLDKAPVRMARRKFNEWIRFLRGAAEKGEGLITR